MAWTATCDRCGKTAEATVNRIGMVVLPDGWTQRAWPADVVWLQESGQLDVGERVLVLCPECRPEVEQALHDLARFISRRLREELYA